MVCPKCGKQFEGVFCPWCGSSAESAELEKRSDEEIAAEEEAFKAEETLKAEEEKKSAEQDAAQKQAEEAAVASGEKIRCPKCGNVFSGNFCPACGAKAIEIDRCPVCGAPHNAGDKFCAKCGYSYVKKPSAAAVTMAGIGAAIKNSCKSALAFCKKYSKKVIAAAVAIALILVIVVPISVVFTSPVHPANVDRIKIGDTQERVLSILGDPYDWEEGDLTFDYYSNNYLKIRKQLDEIANMDDMESFGDLADALEKEEKLNAKLETLEYKQTRVSFDEDGLVEKIVFNASARERSSDEEDKELKSKEILTESVRIYERSDVIYTLKYKDKSIVKAKAQITPEELSDSYTFSIDDPFAPENEIEFSCKVVENPDSDILYNVTINDVKYYLTADGTLTISGNGKVVRDGIKKSGDIKKIEVQEGITEIEQGAFGDCYNLKNITLPFIGASLNALENTHFRYIFGNDNNSVPSTLKKVVITGGTSIGAEAFLNCDSLASITIPEGVRSIGSYAFSGCSSLTSISIPESVTSIGNYILQGCTGIGSLTIPKITGRLGDYFGEDDENNYNSMVPESLKTVIITGGENIPSYAFYNCDSLTSITIGGSVTSIGNSAFYNCDSLKEVHISDIATWCDIDFGSGSANPLYNGAALYLNGEIVTSLEIPESVTSIGYAFTGCSSLTSITIPDNVTSIASGAFSGCSGLESITIPFVGGSMKTASDTYQYPFGYIFGTSFYTGSARAIQHYYGSSTSSTTYSDYYIPSSLKSITVTGGNILYGAFDDCGVLTSITIGDGVTSIGINAFYDCNSLTGIIIPDSVTSISNGAFAYCSSLESIIVEEGNTVYHSEGNCLIETDSKTLVVGCKNSVIPSDGSVTSIGNYAFIACPRLTSITIPESVTSIGDSAFQGCSSLTSITIGNGVTSIGDRAFSGCSWLKKVHISDIAAWCAIDFENGSANPFSHSAALYLNGEIVTSLEIPESVTSIGDYAFYECSSLTSITIPDSVTSIGDYAFSSCSSLKSITIPESVTSIGDDAFYNCDSLTSINIPDSVTSIGRYAFYRCDSLTSITIPDSVTSIGDWTFSICDSLTSVTIGDGITSIGDYAFQECSSLTSINFQGSMAQWKAIYKGRDWNNDTGSFMVTCTDGTLDKSGNQVS